MKNKTLNKLYMAVTLLLGAAGLVMILISVFSEDAPRSVMTAGMIAVALGTILNVGVRGRRK